ncbi:MAG: hypothetical protein R6X18_17480, partial [Chloroflexota bacterium]
MKRIHAHNPRILPGLLIALAGILVLLSACTRGSDPDTTIDSSPTAAPTVDEASNQPVRGQAQVDEVEVLILESFPVQVSVIARGELPDSCTRIDEIISQRAEDTFRVAITTLRQPDTVCTQVIVPFEQTIALDVAGLPAGTNTVSVNGVPATFTLDVDNVLSEDVEATPD